MKLLSLIAVAAALVATPALAEWRTNPTLAKDGYLVEAGSLSVDGSTVHVRVFDPTEATKDIDGTDLDYFLMTYTIRCDANTSSVDPVEGFSLNGTRVGGGALPEQPIPPGTRVEALRDAVCAPLGATYVVTDLPAFVISYRSTL